MITSYRCRFPTTRNFSKRWAVISNTFWIWISIHPSICHCISTTSCVKILGTRTWPLNNHWRKQSCFSNTYRTRIFLKDTTSNISQKDCFWTRAHQMTWKKWWLQNWKPSADVNLHQNSRGCSRICAFPIHWTTVSKRNTTWVSH